MTEISKITSKSILGRIIIGKGLSVDSSGRTSVVSKNDGITVNENDIQLNTINNLTTNSETKPLSAKQGKILEENKQNKNDNTLKTTAKNIVGAINELFTELWKTGSTTQFGRFKVGKNLSVDENGFLNGTPQYTHPTGNGNSHLPSGGATGKFIKWLSSGVGQWASITWNDITGKPSSFTPSSHNHTKAEIKDFPASLKNPTPLTIQANGTSLGSYDGSAAKTFNITAGNIGASPGNHNHDSTYSKTSHTHTASQVGAYTKNEIDTKFKNSVPVPVGGVLVMYNNTNPAELFSGTTWELITAGKYIQSGSTALQTGGSNSISISKVNLPNIKLKIDTVTATIPEHNHKYARYVGYASGDAGNAPVTQDGNGPQAHFKYYYTDNGGAGNTGSISLSTETLGSGTALTIQPAYITLKFWKRLT